jgi:hypothetical protein
MADREVSAANEPAFNHPNVRDLHHQHGTMMALQEMRGRSTDQSRSESNQASPAGSSTDPTNVDYLGDEHRCSICLDEYATGNPLARLACGHSFHETCWTEVLLRDEHPTCPCCRSGGHVIAHFRYIAPESPRNDNREEFATPHGTPTFPWWPGSSGSAAAFHSTTQVPGHLSVVVDPGAWTNLAGLDWAERATAGLKTTRNRCQTRCRLEEWGKGFKIVAMSRRCRLPFPTLIHPQSQEEGTAPIVRGESVYLISRLK